MFKRCGSYLADWRDATGKRFRKAFPTARQAKAFEKKRKQQARAAIPTNPTRPSTPSRRRGRSAQSRTTSGSRRNSATP
jgi:hypothetical protein